MEVWQTLLTWLHFASIGVGGVATFGIPLIGATMGGAPPEARPALSGLAMRMSRVGRMALGVLILTGAILVAIGPGIQGVNGWFWIKMALILGLIAGIAAGLRAAKRARAGETAAAARAALIGKVNIVIFLLIILVAGLAFG